MLGAVDYADALDRWLTYKPRDSVDETGASFHREALGVLLAQTTVPEDHHQEQEATEITARKKDC
jgi:hypothetical protein